MGESPGRVNMLLMYTDNLFILALRNIIFYLDYLSVMFSLFEFFGILAFMFIVALFRLFFLNTLFGPTLATYPSSNPSLPRSSSRPSTVATSDYFLVLRALRAFVS